MVLKKNANTLNIYNIINYNLTAILLTYVNHTIPYNYIRQRVDKIRFDRIDERRRYFSREIMLVHLCQKLFGPRFKIYFYYFTFYPNVTAAC